MLHYESKGYDACFYIVIERKSRMTIEINTNFFRDLREITENYMINEWGWKETEVKNIKDEDFFCFYFSAQMRFPSQTPREIMYPPGFSIPENYTVGWDFLKNKIESGESLYPHLSRKSTRPGWVDGMSNEWGINHFHLGTNPNPKNQLLIEGTRELLLAMFTDEKFYIIGFYDHEHWTDASTLEIVHKNWPELISHFRYDTACPETILSEDQRRILRKRATNAYTIMSDGTVYFPTGGGVCSNGTSAIALIKYDKLQHKLAILSSDIQSNREILLKKFPEESLKSTKSLDAIITVFEQKPTIVIVHSKIRLLIDMNLSKFLSEFSLFPGITA